MSKKTAQRPPIENGAMTSTDPTSPPTILGPPPLPVEDEETVAQNAHAAASTLQPEEMPGAPAWALPTAESLLSEWEKTRDLPAAEQLKLILLSTLRTEIAVKVALDKATLTVEGVADLHAMARANL